MNENSSLQVQAETLKVQNDSLQAQISSQVCGSTLKSRIDFKNSTYLG